MLRAATLAYWHLGSTSMLLWAAAVLLPLLIHLWSRRRFQTTDWAAMTFLLAAMRQNARRVRLEQWLLLAVRTLLLLLFALALADPMSSVFSSWSAAGQGGRTHTVIVLDGSYSMDYRDEQSSRFERAKDYARRLVDQSLQGDGFTLVLMAEPPRIVIGQPAFDGGDVLQELDAAELSHSGASLPATLAAVETILKEADQTHPRLTRRQVVFLTDLQRRTWQDASQADLRQRVARISEGASLSVIDFGGSAETNVALARLEALEPLSTVASDTVFQAEVQNLGGEALSRQPVTLLVDGQVIAEQRVDLQPAERTTVAFSHRFDQPGEHVVEVRLGEDKLAIDNHRWLSVPVEEAIRVLCVYGQPGETRYVALALEPSSRDRARVLVEQAPESSIVEADLDSYNCVVLANVGRVSRDEAAVLHRYVARGGGLMIFLGDRVQADSYNQQLGEFAGANRLLPAELGDVASEAQYRLNPLGYRHPIVSPFRGFERSGLLTTPIWSYVKLQPSKAASVVLAFDNGDPALVEEKVGQGRVLLFASAASPESVNSRANPPTPWTALSSWPSFPPLVQEMLSFSLSGHTAGRNQLVGDDLRGDVPGATPGTAVQITGPGNVDEKLPLVLDADGAHWNFGRASQSGPYRVSIGPPISKQQQFVLNVNTAESDLQRLGADSLPSQFATDLQPAGVEASVVSDSPSRSYFRELLLGVMGLAVVEIMLAWHLGRGTA